MNEYQETHSPEAKRAAAKARQEFSDKLTPQERLARLDARLGDNAGAIRERLHLHELIHRAEKSAA